ncbi:MAG: hypothetical protein ACOYL5_12340 [Phototrophicaceae bacterium]
MSVTSQGKKILIISGSEALILFLRRGLSRYNREFDIATNGLSALSLFDASVHNQAVVDWMFDDISGVDLSCQLHDLLPAAYLTLLMPAFHDEDEKRQCLAWAARSTANHSVFKPIRADQILTLLRPYTWR